MKRFRFLAILFVASMALTACDKEDNPAEPSIINVDDPQEVVTDQPASARTR